MFNLLKDAKEKIRSMASRGEGITERNWTEVQDCLVPGKENWGGIHK